AIRQRVALLMNVGRWATADQWLGQIYTVSQAPQDMVSHAALKLVQGDIPGALDVLRPATDPDAYRAQNFLHPDRWANNTAAQAYFLRKGVGAQRGGDWAPAETVFHQAVAGGPPVVGRYFLAQTRGEKGASNAAQQVRADLDTIWSKTHEAPLPPLESILAL